MIIKFVGIIVSGQSSHKNLGIPGKHSLPNAPSDWPKILCPGSLNVKVKTDQLPVELDKLGEGRCIKKFDNGILKPLFVIPQSDITNNTIGPNCRIKGRGDAQVWRAKINVVKSGEVYDCWVLRRLDSGMSIHIELVSDKKLREILNLNDGDDVIVSIEGGI